MLNLHMFTEPGWAIFKRLIIRNSFWYVSFLGLFWKQRDFIAISGQLGTTKDMIVKTSIVADAALRAPTGWF